MRYSLNQIEKVFSDLANSHQQINSFGYGDIDQINISGNTEYPLMYVVLMPQGSNVSGKNVNLNYSFLFIDKADHNNIQEVESDMLQVALDIRASLNNPVYDDYFSLNDNSSIDFFNERFEDVVAGVNMGITLTVLDLKDRCQIPTE